MLVLLALVAVAAVAVAAVTLAGDDDATADAPPAAVSVDDLDAALLTIDDVGGDYVVDVEDDDDGDTPDFDASAECRMALGVIEGSDAAQSGQEVRADFANDVEGGVQHEMMLPAEGYPGLDALRGAMDQCGYVEYEDEGFSGSLGYETSDVDGLGDSAFSADMYVEVRAAGGSAAFQMYGVFWERDGVVSTVTGAGGMDPVTFAALPTDPAEVERLAAIADERLADVLAG